MKAKANYKGSDGKDVVFAGMTWCHETHWCEKCGWKEGVPELGTRIAGLMDGINAGKNDRPDPRL